MITINMQWLMYPCFIYAFICFLRIVYVACIDLGGPWNELRGLGTLYTIVIYSPQFALAMLLGFLFWKAFRPSDITI